MNRISMILFTFVLSLFLATIALAQTLSVPGDEVTLTGIIYDEMGMPVEGAIVQLWQTDGNGYYDHPNAPNTDLRLEDFQFYGSATTDEMGQYTFQTIRPGEYPGRPAHLHYKVWIDESAVLTSQFYIEDERVLFEADPFFSSAENAEMTVIDIVADESGLFTAQSDVYVQASEATATVPLTPFQVEGPFYPVVDFFAYDNDLVDPVISTMIPDIFILGDVNCDGSSGLLDVVLMQQVDVNLISESADCLMPSQNMGAFSPACDINEDGACSLIDALILSQCNALLVNEYCGLGESITVHTAYSYLEDPDILFIDVREQSEYDAGHIPDITLIPMGEVADRLDEIPMDQPVVLTCRSGNRSGQVATYLREQGYTNIHNMTGGITAWQAAGYPVVQ